eukprot:GFUD01009536.1.p1 GENE.GFUD01009536.1~~GFUD01009536.1.p1  ORF type:complete len:303 (+),score=116.24 GFUD01009536.1:146-1054(+)
MNRNFLVTGGAQGIGLAMSRQILSKGGRVFFTDINVEYGEKTRTDLEKDFGVKNVGFAEQDVTKEEQWRTVWDMAEKFFEGRVEVLCNNAGIFSKKDWKKVLDINLTGLAVGTMLAMEKMGASRGGPGGLIVQTGSMASFLAGFDTVEESAYTASKQAVLGYCRSLANEKTYKVEKVRMVGICPWFVNTELVRSQVGSVNEVEQKYQIRELEAHEVGAAFDRLVVTGLSGQMLVVMPGFMFFWPDWNRNMLAAFSMACKFCIKVLGHQSAEPVTPQQLMQVGFILFLIIAILFHCFLSWLGF